jgi:hypothetical protein
MITGSLEGVRGKLLLEGRPFALLQRHTPPGSMHEQSDVPDLAKTRCEQPPTCIRSCSPMILMRVVWTKTNVGDRTCG